MGSLVVMFFVAQETKKRRVSVSVGADCAGKGTE
jgi:hypothetical protein